MLTLAVPRPLQALVSLLWQVAEYLTLTIRRSIYRPIHPGAHIGMHLVLWVLALIVTLFCCFTLSYALTSWSVDAQCNDSFGYYTSSSSSSDSYVYCDFYHFPSSARAHLYFGLLEALTAFAVLMLVCHFALFVLACIETDRRRKWGKQARVVYLVAAPAPAAGAADGRTYYSPVQQPPPMAMTAGPRPELYGYFAPEAPAARAAPAEGRHA